MAASTPEVFPSSLFPLLGPSEKKPWTRATYNEACQALSILSVDEAEVAIDFASKVENQGPDQDGWLVTTNSYDFLFAVAHVLSNSVRLKGWAVRFVRRDDSALRLILYQLW